MYEAIHNKCNEICDSLVELREMALEANLDYDEVEEMFTSLNEFQLWLRSRGVQ